jgi:hypothetical protein
MDMLSRRTGGDYSNAEGEASAPTSISDLIEWLTGFARRQYHTGVAAERECDDIAGNGDR